MCNCDWFNIDLNGQLRKKFRQEEIRKNFWYECLLKEERVATQTQKKQDGQYGHTRETLKRSDIQHIVQVIEPNGRAYINKSRLI